MLAWPGTVNMVKMVNDNRLYRLDHANPLFTEINQKSNTVITYFWSLFLSLKNKADLLNIYIDM